MTRFDATFGQECLWLQCGDGIGCHDVPREESDTCAVNEAHDDLGLAEEVCTQACANESGRKVDIQSPDVEDARTVEDVTGEDTGHIGHSELHKDLLQHHSVAEVKWIPKTHEQLEAPLRAVHLRWRCMTCDERSVALARMYSCEGCFRRSRTRAVRFVPLPHAVSCNEVVDVDTFLHLLEGDPKDGAHNDGRGEQV